jgi:uncharacterized protein
MFFQSYGLYILFSLPALLLGLWAQFKVKSAYAKYSKVRTYIGLTGQQVARRLLDQNGLNNVAIEETTGFLSDHYDPGKKVLRLSPDVYRSNSIAAAGVAAHEAGHALQDQQDYFPLRIRTAIVPTVQIGSWLGLIIFFVGFFLAGSFGIKIATAGLLIFATTAVFAIVTLPVEFNATQRAKEWLSTSGVVVGDEIKGINQVLDAAALTYVAAAAQAISTVLYYAFLLSGLGSRRR